MPRKPKYGHVGGIYEYECLDCGTPLTWIVTRGGHPVRRCSQCWEKNERAVDQAYSYKWRREHPGRWREIQRETYERRKDVYTATLRRKRATDPEWAAHEKATRRKWYQKRYATPSGRQLYRNARFRRRSREQAQGGRELTGDDWLHTLDAFDYRCAYCGVSDEEEPLTQDHFHPLSRGGETELGNMVPACGSCNSRKHDHSPEDFLDEQTYYWVVNVLCELS